MMEIKFRGYRLDAQGWAYGQYHLLPPGESPDGAKMNERHCIIEPGYIAALNAKIYSFKVVDVDPDTVGRYLNLKDKRGNEFYDGDVAKIVYEHSTNGQDKYYVFPIYSTPFGHNLEPWMFSDPEMRPEKIGNIHGKPELLSNDEFTKCEDCDQFYLDHGIIRCCKKEPTSAKTSKPSKYLDDTVIGCGI